MITNDKLQQYANLIRLNWELNILSDDLVRNYQKTWGFSSAMCQKHLFFEYLENFSERGKVLPSWSCLVDRVLLGQGINEDLYGIDYQIIFDFASMYGQAHLENDGTNLFLAV